jgi:AcrR family transcriptional regulator
MPSGRKLKLKQRAAHMAETRQRITEATYELHRSVGMAQTTISAIAARAGVQRLTVYHHFPREQELFQACISHGMALDPPPDPALWRERADPGERLRPGLLELYGWYRRNEALLLNWQRDLPVVLPRLAGEVPPAMEAALRLPGELQQALVYGWPPVAERPELGAVLGLAVDLTTWHTLARQGLDDAVAAELMTRLVLCVAAEPTS